MGVAHSHPRFWCLFSLLFACFFLIRMRVRRWMWTWRFGKSQEMVWRMTKVKYVDEPHKCCSARCKERPLCRHTVYTTSSFFIFACGAHSPAMFVYKRVMRLLLGRIGEKVTQGVLCGGSCRRPIRDGRESCAIEQRWQRRRFRPATLTGGQPGRGTRMLLIRV